MTISFRVKLLASHAAVAIAVGAVTLVVVERSVSQRMEAQVDRRLEAQARAVARWMERAAHPNRLAGRLAGVVGARVTILDRRGIAVGESRSQPVGGPEMDTEEQSAEVRAARAGNVGRDTRFSALEREQIRYVAVPGPEDSVVRLGLAIGEIDETKAELRRQLGVAAIASLLVALALAAVVAGPLTQRLRDATAIAQRIGAGDYDVAPPSSARDEVGVLSRTLAGAAAELRETEHRRREFLATVAHEIRTPVTSIRGYAQTLSGSQVAAEDRDEFLQTIHRNAVRVGQLVEDLLELEALQAGKGRALAAESVALEPVARHVVETLRARVAEVGAEVTIDVAGEATARGDADGIERILLNLTDNALRHGGRGQRVAIVARNEVGRAIATVSDDGPGIPAEQCTRIFERFHRGAAGRHPDQRGTGLGLAIARELAHAMGGTLVVSSEEGAGATFTLDLPA
ncbi:MAG: ATP-binding protein [Proteobacteria bacterium]|nr:ATP-binding protein [Pseudomonadota bacterium]